MYQFILYMWVLGKVDDDFIEMQYSKGRLTEKEKHRILATPRNK